jgi:hypothetical protein
VAVADRHLDGGPIPIDQQLAGVELHEVELRRDEPQPLESLLFALARSAERMQVGRNMDYMTEIVRKTRSPSTRFCARQAS